KWPDASEASRCSASTSAAKHRLARSTRGAATTSSIWNTDGKRRRPISRFAITSPALKNRAGHATISRRAGAAVEQSLSFSRGAKMHPTRSARGSRIIPRLRDSHARRCGVQAVAATLSLVAFANLVGAQDPTQVRRLLALLRGVEQEYREAFDENGALVRPMELEEAKLLLA